MSSSRPSVLITQGQEKSQRLRQPLEAAGFLVHSIPLIEIKQLDPPEFEEALADLAGFDWLLFTSSNSVRITAERAGDLKQWPPRGPRIGVVGPGTAKSLQARGVQPHLIASDHQAEGFYRDLKDSQNSLDGLRVLLPLARIARPWLRRRLSQAGARVTAPSIYDTVPAESNRQALNQLLRNNPPDVITLASSSAAENLVALAESPDLLTFSSIAAIGPVTARRTQELGLTVGILPARSTLPDLAASICDFLRAR